MLGAKGRLVEESHKAQPGPIAAQVMVGGAVAHPAATSGSGGMGKHAGRKARRCALSLP